MARIFTVDASAETADGRWRLRVSDKIIAFHGHLDAWALQF
ncbi:proprotein convertase P-domain-containing protein [Kitasatospora sp. NBC_00374]